MSNTPNNVKSAVVGGMFSVAYWIFFIHMDWVLWKVVDGMFLHGVWDVLGHGFYIVLFFL